MKMKKKLFLILLTLAIIPLTARAQSPGAGMVQIGDTTSMNLSTYDHMPYDQYSSSYTQQLVLRSELSGAAMITGIDLYCGSADASGRPGTTIYLANTYADNLQGGMVPFGVPFQQVMVDSLVCTTGWNHYDFDTPFYYNGLGNLIVAFESPFSDWMFSGGQFYCSFRQDMSRYAATPLAYLTPNTSTTLVHYRNVMRLHTQPAPTAASTCPPPTLRIDSVGATAIRLNWSPGYQDTSWTVEALTDGDTSWLSSGLLWGDTAYTLGGLQPNTHYTLRLTAFCSDTFTCVLRHVLTNCVPAPLPYSENFDATWNMPSCWLPTEGWSGNYPAVSSSYSHSSAHSLHLYGGSLVLPAFDAPPDSMELSFWALNGSVNSSLNLLVGMVSDPLDMSTFVPMDTLALTAGWTPAVVRFDGYTRPSGRIAIRSTISYIYIDDIEVNRTSLCHTIMDVNVDQVTDTGAVVHWTDSNAVYYEVAYGPTGFTIDSTHIVTDIRTDSLQLTGLLPYTQYDVYVRPYCGSTPPNWSLVRTFRTLCGLLDTLPYSVDFEAATLYSLPHQLPCWQGYADLNTLVTSASDAHSGSKELRWWWTPSGGNQLAVLPGVNTSANPINTLQLTFWAQNMLNTYNLYSEARLLVGVMTDPEADSTFQVVDTVRVIGNEWRRYDVPLSNYSGSGLYVALRDCAHESDPRQWIAFIDDLTLDIAPSCPSVTGMKLTGLTATTVTVAWDEGDSNMQWQAYIDSSSTARPLDGGSRMTTPTCTFAGLTAEEQYYVWVRAFCPKGDTSGWEGPLAVMPGTWNMRSNRHDTLTMCGVQLHDNGGPNGNFAAQSSSLAILPAEPSSLVTVSGSIDINNISSLIIYDSIGTAGHVLWARADEIYPETFGPITSESGALTLIFDGSIAGYASSGFDLTVDCVADSCRVKKLRLDPAIAPSDTLLVLTWECNGAASYQVEYGPVGFAQGSGTTDSTTGTTYVLRGLKSMEHRDVYVRPICGTGDTGSWVRGSFGTEACPDATFRENYDSTLVPSTAIMVPIGANNANYSYTQTIIDSAFLSGLEGGITALAFHPSSLTEGDHLTHITVYLANVPEEDLSAGPILPDSGHRFVRVIDSANFYHNLLDGWQLHRFDHPFMWDGHQNLLVAVKRDDGGTGKPTRYYGHYPYGLSPQRTYTIADYAPIDIDSADTYAYGYPLWVTGDLRLYTNTCDLPLCASPTVDSVTADYESVTVSWSGSSASYQLKITPDEGGIGTVSVVGNSHTFTTLQPGSTYCIALRQDCTADSLGLSEWVSVEATTDTFVCVAPENVTVSDITYNSALIDWDASGSDSLWQLDVWAIGDRHNSILATSHPYQVENLSPGTTYAAYVHAFCGQASQIAGLWSDTLFFSTPSCPAVTGLDTSEVTTSSITLQWNAEPMAQSYIVEYGTAGFPLGTGTEATVATNSFTATGLEPGQSYDFYVLTRCADNWYADAYDTLLQISTHRPLGIDTATGERNQLGMVLKPNPAHKSTTLWLSGLPEAFAERIDVSIVDLTGRAVLTRRLKCNGRGPVELDVTGLPCGAYFVHLQIEQQTMVRKLIIQ